MSDIRRSRALVRAVLVLFILAAVVAGARPARLAASSAPLLPSSSVCPTPDLSRLYVNATVITSGDGSWWGAAYKTLTEALATASICSNVAQVWVAQGTYTPTSGTDRTATFQLRNGLAVYGGFSGNGTEVLLSQRAWQTNVTTLSGEIGGAGNTDNSYHVVTGSGTNSTAILDGFTISGGNASGSSPNDSGGGMVNSGGSPTVTNVVFIINSSQNVGGGMANVNSSSPTLTDVSFNGNSAGASGGGMYNANSNPKLTRVTFGGNSASSGDGGGMVNSGSSPTLTNVTFNGNSATGNGGGMFNTTQSSPTLDNVVFNANTANGDGGGMYNMGSSSPVLTDVVFTGNFALGVGGGGMFNLSSSAPTLTNVTFTANYANVYGGGMRNYGSSPTLTNTVFSGNLASTGGGGGLANYGSSPILTNVTFSGNVVSDPYGIGGGMYNLFANPTIRNSILWGDSAATGPEIFNDSSTPTISFSNVKGGYPGTGNMNADPLFVTPVVVPDPPAPTASGNLRLTAGSPAVNAGDPASTFASPADKDLDGGLPGE